jgi:hypothetical protein
MRPNRSDPLDVDAVPVKLWGLVIYLEFPQQFWVNDQDQLIRSQEAPANKL